MKDYIQLAQEYANYGKHHLGIIVSNHPPFSRLLRRMLRLILRHDHEELTDKLFWLQDYKRLDPED